MHPADTIEQSFCRQRTEEEDRAVEMCMLFRAFLDCGAREMRFDDCEPSVLD